VGIPPTLLGALLIPVYLFQLSIPIFLFALVSFVGGYLIQFLGHVFERTDPGELIYFKRKLGMSYVEFAPRNAGGSGSPREARPDSCPVDEADRRGPRSDRAAHHLTGTDVSP